MFKILSVFLILNLSIIEVATATQQNMNKNFNASGEKLNSEEMDAKMFKEIDSNGDGCVSFEEFKAFSKKRMQHQNMMQKQNADVNK